MFYLKNKQVPQTLNRTVAFVKIMIEKYALFKVIKAIIRENEELSLRNIAKKAKVGPSTAKTCLDYLEHNLLVRRRIVGKNHLFKLENIAPLVRQVKILFSLAELNSSRLVSEIRDKISSAELISITLYGSVAKGLDDSQSDIDLLILTRKKTDHHLAMRSEKRLSREVTYLKYTYTDWKEKAEKDPTFYKEVVFNCIPLYGEKPVVL